MNVATPLPEETPEKVIYTREVRAKISVLIRERFFNVYNTFPGLAFHNGQLWCRISVQVWTEVRSRLNPASRVFLVFNHILLRTDVRFRIRRRRTEQGLQGDSGDDSRPGGMKGKGLCLFNQVNNLEEITV